MTHRQARTAFWLDVLILLAAVFTIAIDLSGGFYAEPFGSRVSIRRPERPLVIVLLLVFVRWRWWRSREFLGRPSEWYGGLWRRYFRRDADPDAGTPPRAHLVAASFGLIAIACLMLQAQLRQMMSVPDLGDPLFSMWRMGWVYRQLLGDPRALFDANIFHPAPLTFTFSEAMLLPSLVAAPLFAAGLHPVVIYNGLLVAGFPATGIATYVLLRRLVPSSGAAFVGAVFYMCHPYRLEHYSHLEQLQTMWMPLMLWAAIRFGETGKSKFALVAGAGAVAQVYSSMYFAVYFPFYFAVVIVALAVLRGWNWRRLMRPAVITALLAVVLVAPLARVFLAAQPLKGERGTFAVEYYSAEPADYLRPHFRLATHKDFWLENKHPERALFPGVTPLVLSGIALMPPIGVVRLAFTAGLVVAFDLSRGLKGDLYRVLYDYFPPIRGTRVAARFAVILGISLAVLAAFGARRLLARWTGPRRHLMFAGIVAVMLIDLRPGLELYPVWPDAPRIYESLEGRRDVVLAEIPFDIPLPMVTDDVPYQYFSIWHGHDMVNGCSAFFPEGYEQFSQIMRGFPDNASIVALRSRGVTHVTVNCPFVGDGCRVLMDAVDKRPEFKLVQVAHWRGRSTRGMEPVRLYEFTR